MPEDSGDRTEQPTGKRRDEAKKKGQIPKSKELIAVFSFLGIVSVFYLHGSGMFEALKNLMQQSFSFSQIKPFTVESTQILLHQTMKVILSILAAPLLLIMVFGLGGSMLQTGFLFTPESITMDFSKLSPLNGLKGLVSIKSFIEGIKALVKVFLVSYIAYKVLKKEFVYLPSMLELELPAMLSYLGAVSIKLIFWIITFFFFLGIGDYMYERWNTERSLKMTKQEVKEENKQSEGDPHIKGKIRQMQKQAAMKRMMQDVPKADVIIRNPTHFAIAIKYDYQKMDAPKVIAKGQGVIAENIIRVARENFIPIIEDKPLARLLYKVTEIGQEIPKDIYQAVAKILAYVYSLKAG